jgi:hypothetical protein
MLCDERDINTIIVKCYNTVRASARVSLLPTLVKECSRLQKLLNSEHWKIHIIPVETCAENLHLRCKMPFRVHHPMLLSPLCVKTWANWPVHSHQAPASAQSAVGMLSVPNGTIGHRHRTGFPLRNTPQSRRRAWMRLASFHGTCNAHRRLDALHFSLAFACRKTSISPQRIARMICESSHTHDKYISGDQSKSLLIESSSESTCRFHVIPKLS